MRAAARVELRGGDGGFRRRRAAPLALVPLRYRRNRLADARYGWRGPVQAGALDGAARARLPVDADGQEIPTGAADGLRGGGRRLRRQRHIERGTSRALGERT